MTGTSEMNESPPSGGEPGDWLDALLARDGREHRAGYLDDDGFTARVMAALPPPAAALPAWRKPALAGLWAVAGIGIAFALPGTVRDVAHEVMRAILAQRVSASGLGAAFVALVASAWAAAALVLRSD